MQVYRVEVGAGNEIWRDENGSFHREGGPACKHANGDKVWFWHGKYHREDGPALEYANGYKAWYLHGLFFENEEAWKRAKQGEVSSPPPSPSCENKVVEIEGKKYKLTLV